MEVFLFSTLRYLIILNSSKDVLEREPLENLVKRKQLIAYKHKSYWRCMDNLNEKNQLEEIFKKIKQFGILSNQKNYLI